MTFENALIGFALITMTALTIEIFYTYLAHGFGYGFSSNRPAVERTALGLRIQRAYQNQIESTAYIVPVLAAAALLNPSSEGAAIAAALIVIGRAAFVVLYYTGVPFIRIIGFSCASLSTLYLAVTLLLSVTA
ncbi:MAG: MAPEG family protein [Arenibacterium sp.]